MSQLSRVIELIRLTGQAGFLMEGEKEPLVILPLANYEQLTSGNQSNQIQAELWSQVLQEQIDTWQKQQTETPATPTATTPAKPKTEKTFVPIQEILQAKADLSEVMEEEVVDEVVDEYLPEPEDETNDQ